MGHYFEELAGRYQLVDASSMSRFERDGLISPYFTIDLMDRVDIFGLSQGLHDHV